MKAILITFFMTLSFLFLASGSAFADKAENECYKSFKNKDWKAETSYCLEAAKNDSAPSQISIMKLVQLNLLEPSAPTIKWLKYSAFRGNRLSQTTLAIAYHYGRGVKQDFVEAYIWAAILKELSKGRNTSAASELFDLARRQLGPFQLKHANVQFRRRYKKVLEARQKICSGRDKLSTTCW